MAFGNYNFDSYVIHQENEAMKIVSHLNEYSIADIVKQDISQRYNFNILLPINNLPSIIENTFKQSMEMYPESVEELNTQKDNLYRLILDIISYECNVSITIPEDASLYSYTYYIYDFLVSNFKQHLITFYTNFIVKEKNTIYQEMNLAEFKKDKNSSAKYGKMIYSNPKLAVISAYLNLVVYNMSAFDISLENILSNIYANPSIVTSLIESINTHTSFYQEQYVRLTTNEFISQSIISNIRIGIHNIAVN